MESNNHLNPEGTYFLKMDDKNSKIVETEDSEKISVGK